MQFGFAAGRRKNLIDSGKSCLGLTEKNDFIGKGWKNTKNTKIHHITRQIDSTASQKS